DIFFFRDHDLLEVWRESRSLDFEPLLLFLTLSEKKQSVPRRQIIQRLSNAGQQVKLDLHDPPAKVHHVLEVTGLDGSLRQSLIGFTEVASKGGGPVAMDAAVEPFDLIERGTHLLSGERRVREKVDEVLDCLLEVDVVLPQRV